jgi:tyrosine-protein phosphatase SIW14
MATGHRQDRTGIVVAAFRMRVQGWRLPEMQSFGFNDMWVNFKRFIRNYGAAVMKNRKTAAAKPTAVTGESA